jgi:lipopolysaccharide transport system permease protein
MAGLIPWLWFVKTVTNAMNSITHGKGLMVQVHIPKIILPAIVICQDMVKQTIVMLLLLFFLLFSGIDPTWSWCALPILIATELLLISACALLAAAIIPFLPDFSFLISTGLQMLFFCSGIFFKAEEMILEKHLTLFYLNPMANLLKNYRNALLYNQWPDWQSLAVISFASLITILIMWRVIRRLDHIYPRVVA